MKILLKNPNIWKDIDKNKSILKNLTIFEKDISNWEIIYNSILDLKNLFDLAKLDKDEILFSEIEENLNTIEKKIKKLDLSILLSGPYDQNNAFFSINSGAGGTESCDWVSMLIRMYIRWFKNNHIKYELINQLLGEETGIKSIDFFLQGSYVYGKLRGEIGIHRLVRISPFDSNKKRHTSFASIFVLPELQENINLDIQQKDLKIDTFRAQGAGGQHVNTTDSAIRITHIPSGIVVQCQNERSQHKNKSFAMNMLKSKLYDFYQKEQQKKINQFHSSKENISWGNQIRSYILHPYRLIKDHRTKMELHNVDSILDGNLDDLIYSYLKWESNHQSG